jgi:hypothetical protein
MALHIQDDSLESGPELIIYGARKKRNLASLYFGRSGDNWIADNVVIGFPLLGDTDRHNPRCWRMSAASMVWEIL